MVASFKSRADVKVSSAYCNRKIDGFSCVLQQIFAFIWFSVAIALGFLVWTLYDKIKVRLSEHYMYHLA